MVANLRAVVCRMPCCSSNADCTWVSDLQPVMYMLFHFLLSAAAAATSYFCWHSFYYHTAFILLMLLGAAWNGEGFPHLCHDGCREECWVPPLPPTMAVRYSYFGHIAECLCCLVQGAAFTSSTLHSNT